MEPTAKKPRLGAGDHVDDDDDELNFEPEEISQRRDPGYQLQQERGYAANRLKTALEHIFLKYGRDFNGVGDEIDLRTGEIVVNNGHLRNMRNEKDAGDEVDEYEDEDEDKGILLSEMYGSDDDDEPDDDAEENLILQGKGKNATVQPAPEERPARKPTSGSRNAPVPTPIRLATQNRLANLNHSRYTPQKPSPLSAGPWEVDETFVDPAWRAPPLVRSSLPPMRTPARDENLYQLPAVKGTDSLWASDSSNMEWPSGGYIPKARGPVVSSSPTRRFMPAQPEVDDEDEILMGGPDKPTAKRAGSMKKLASGPLSIPQEKAGPKKQQRKAKGAGKGKKLNFAKPPRTPESSKSEPDVRPRHTFMVAIPFRTPPPPDSLTIVDDTSPQSDRTRGDSAAPTSKGATQRTPVQASEMEAEPINHNAEQLPAPVASQPPIPPDPAAVASVSENDPEITEQKDAPPPPVEQFSRNEIDPAYEFSDEDDLPPRRPLGVAPLVPGKQAPAVVAEADVPQDAEPVVKRKPGRPKGWKKQKSKPDDVLPSIVEATIPSSPPRPLFQVQPLLPVDVIIRDSEEDPSSAEVEELPELAGLSDDQELPDVEEILAAQEQLEAEEAQEDQGLPDAEEATEAQVLPDQEPIDTLGDIFLEYLPMSDPPEVGIQTQNAAEKTHQEPSTTIASSKSLRKLALKATAEANIPSPIRSDDSLTLALDSIIASQGLFDDSDRNPDSSPAKPDESPTRRVASLRSSTRKRRRSVHFLDEELLDNPHTTKIVSTPPLRKGSSQPGEATVASDKETTPPPQDTLPGHEPSPAAPDVIDLTSIPDEVPPSPAGGMFAARKARRRKGASLSSSPAPASLPGVTKPPKRGPAIKRLAKEPKEKRRSLLSIALVDSDDEDPLNAMSLLPTWTAGVAWSPYSASSTPLGAPKRNGSESTTRKRIAREGFGGLSTPTKRTGFMAAGSPSGSVIFTPGGHARRCGVDDFRCGRDFCFTCLEG